VRAWLGSGWTPVWMILLIICAAWHSMLGVQVIIEDYVPRTSVKTVALVVLKFLHAIAGVAAVFAVLKVALQVP
jgi:succinate dehydrogenase / fumarate reductase membrane anchor subunit